MTSEHFPADSDYLGTAPVHAEHRLSTCFMWVNLKCKEGLKRLSSAFQKKEHRFAGLANVLTEPAAKSSDVKPRERF